MITVNEINPICASKWLTEFQNNQLFLHVSKDYQHVISSYREMTVLKAALNDTVYEVPRNFCESKRILDIVPYYYIMPLINSNPQVVVDLGCGLNIFKKIWPDIIGIDADVTSNYDIHDYFDQGFAQGHRQYCDALISINTIHFSSIDTIAQRLTWCAEMLRTGGNAFVSFNLETWLMYTKESKIIELFGFTPKFEDIVNYVDQEIRSIGLNLVINDWPILHVPPESTIRDDLNGNIRLVFNL
jgi:hypothetical protein